MSVSFLWTPRRYVRAGRTPSGALPIPGRPATYLGRALSSTLAADQSRDELVEDGLLVLSGPSLAVCDDQGGFEEGRQQQVGEQVDRVFANPACGGDRLERGSQH